MNDKTTTRARLAANSSLRRQTSATWSRHGSQPKCRRNTSTAGPAPPPSRCVRAAWPRTTPSLGGVRGSPPSGPSLGLETLRAKSGHSSPARRRFRRWRPEPAAPAPAAASAGLAVPGAAAPLPSSPAVQSGFSSCSIASSWACQRPSADARARPAWPESMPRAPWMPEARLSAVFMAAIDANACCRSTASPWPISEPRQRARASGLAPLRRASSARASVAAMACSYSAAAANARSASPVSGASADDPGLLDSARATSTVATSPHSTSPSAPHPCTSSPVSWLASTTRRRFLSVSPSPQRDRTSSTRSAPVAETHS
mmetsp:Transcript_9250/g.36161  ORF Transcript_9250/g.36161 Transcript_9250/m.36161 type:complete len:316 (-) Transcript_9250:147-1094(-)